MADTCATCRFFVERNDYGGHCHRYPQAIAQDGSGSWEQAWPRMNPTEWCGEHQTSDGAEIRRRLFDATRSEKP